MSSVPLAAICQVTCTPDKEDNFAACMRLVEQAKEGGASMVFLPEGFDYIGSNQEETLKLSESLLGNTISRYTQLARWAAVMHLPRWQLSVFLLVKIKDIHSI